MSIRISLPAWSQAANHLSLLRSVPPCCVTSSLLAFDDFTAEVFVNSNHDLRGRFHQRVALKFIPRGDSSSSFDGSESILPFFGQFICCEYRSVTHTAGIAFRCWASGDIRKLHTTIAAAFDCAFAGIPDNENCEWSRMPGRKPWIPVAECPVQLVVNFSIVIAHREIDFTVVHELMQLGDTFRERASLSPEHGLNVSKPSPEFSGRALVLRFVEWSDE